MTMPPDTDQQKRVKEHYERGFASRQGFWMRVFLRVFRRPILTVTNYMLYEASERHFLTSWQLHEIYGIQNRILFPERE